MGGCYLLSSKYAAGLALFVCEGDTFSLDMVTCIASQALYTRPSHVGIPNDKGMHVKVLCFGEMELCSFCYVCN